MLAYCPFAFPKACVIKDLKQCAPRQTKVGVLVVDEGAKAEAFRQSKEILMLRVPYGFFPTNEKCVESMPLFVLLGEAADKLCELERIELWQASPLMDSRNVAPFFKRR